MICKTENNMMQILAKSQNVWSFEETLKKTKVLVSRDEQTESGETSLDPFLPGSHQAIWHLVCQKDRMSPFFKQHSSWDNIQTL